MKTTDKHIFFYTEWPSNFYPAKFTWKAFGEEHDFFCTEQAFMWAKAKNFSDEETASRILAADTPMDCKQLGRTVRGYIDKHWSLVRYNHMYNVNFEKYSQNAALRAKLLDPAFDGKMFVEASPTDCIWGIGRSEDYPLIDNEKKWRGQNLLGRVLTQVREKIVLSLQ